MKATDSSSGTPLKFSVLKFNAFVARLDSLTEELIGNISCFVAPNPTVCFVLPFLGEVFLNYKVIDANKKVLERTL